MKPSTQELDLSYNKLTAQSCEQLALVIARPRSSLCVLNLEGNALGDKALTRFLSDIKSNTTLTTLNLSKNGVGCISFCRELMDFLAANIYLQELYLHWNNICSEGGACIARGLTLNKYLKVIDLSYNSLGHDQQQASHGCALQWKELF